MKKVKKDKKAWIPAHSASLRAGSAQE